MLTVPGRPRAKSQGQGALAKIVARLIALAAALAIIGAGQPALARTGKIALTFDDAPALTIFDDQSYDNAINDALLKGLKRHRFTAIGFVNESKLDDGHRKQQVANLEKWLNAGMDLGNHTYSHESPNTLGADGYIADIQRGGLVTGSLLAKRHRRMHWFRHPYLETGSPLAVKQKIDGWLAEHGYRIAPVTIDADDWEWAEAYEGAIARHDEARRRQIRAQYLEYTDRMITWHREAARMLFGRDIAQVILLHDSRLNADCIDGLAAILKRQKLRVVSLDEALKDPAYRTPDNYAGKDGIGWLERWSQTLGKELPWDSYQDVPQQIVEEYNRVDSDQLNQPAAAPGGR